MAFEIMVLMNQKVVSFSVDAKNVKHLAMYAHTLESPDAIYEIAVSKDYIIVTTERPEARGGIPAPMVRKDRSINNINAYDWKGNHMWNIGEIVGDIRVPFNGGTVTTKNLLIDHAGVDASLIDESHELYCCTSADSYLYIIDLTEKRLIQKVQTK